MTERTQFEVDMDRLIVDRTNALLNDIDRIALRHGVDKHTVKAACELFFGPDLADCWVDYIAEAEL